jgi:hypothetical protein
MSKNNSLTKPSKKPDDHVEQKRPAQLLPGQPGYRTRDGRSGYDPIDSRTEAAHTAGTFIQKMVAGRIRNPIALLLLGLLGLLLITPLILAISTLMQGNQIQWDTGAFILVTGMVGLAILVNFIKNLIKIVIR